LEAGQGLLSTWHALIDDAAGLAGEPHAAAGAPMPVATISPATANEVGVGPGDRLTVANDRGAITLPVRITEMVDHVVHLPTKSPGSWVAQTLAAASGTVVALAKAEEVKK
jgi:NADH-quinone oxidoreductase subunit G